MRKLRRIQIYLSRKARKMWDVRTKVIPGGGNGGIRINTNNLKNNLKVIELEIFVGMMHCWGQQEFLKELEMQTILFSLDFLRRNYL